MAKQLKFTFKDKEYVLEFTRRTVTEMEQTAAIFRIIPVFRKNRNMHIMKCISRRQEIMREEVFHRRNLINRRQLMEAGTAALERRLQQPLPWQ